MTSYQTVSKRPDRLKRKPEPIQYAKELLADLDNPLLALAGFDKETNVHFQGGPVNHYILFEKIAEMQQKTIAKLRNWIKRYSI